MDHDPGQCRDVKHVDTNGDGVVTLDDTLAVNQNYGLTHTSWRGTAAGGSGTLSFNMPTANILPGDTLVIPILLGTVDTPAVGMYGLAFSILYDSMLIEPNSVKVRYDNSWLGTKNNDLITLDKDFFLAGQTDLALVRNDQMNRSSYGKIADLVVVIADDLSKRQIPLVLNFSNVIAIDSAGSTFALTTREGNSTIDTDPANPIDRNFAFDLKAYPNPATDQLILEHETFTFISANLVSITGQKIPIWKGYQTQKVTLPLPVISQGIYMLEVEMKEGRKVLKIEIK